VRTQKGFTLIELMIVVAIVGILATIAMPVFQDYAIRARISEGLSLVNAAKLAVAETQQTTGNFPGSNAAAGLPNTISSPMVDSVTVREDGVIRITYNTDATGVEAEQNIIDLTPTLADNSISWDCTGGTVLDNYRPANCR